MTVKAPRKIPAGEAVSRYEAPRGEDIHYVKANGTEKPERVKVRAPTMANVQAVSHMLKDRYLADVPIVVAAIDPCFSCTDRMIAVATPTRGMAKSPTWEQIRQYGIHWYRAQQGLDFADLTADSARTHRSGGPKLMPAVLNNLIYMLVFPGFAFLTVFALAAEYVDRKLHAKLQQPHRPALVSAPGGPHQAGGQGRSGAQTADRWMFRMTPHGGAGFRR